MNREQAFTTLLEQEKDRVYSYALHVLHHPEDAEDVVQHAFIQLWREWDHIGRDKRKRWLMQVLHNRCMDSIRSRRATGARFLPTGQGHLETATMTVASPLTADARLEGHDVRKVIEAGMETLPDSTRSMMVLHYFQDQPLDGIADLLRVPVGTVKAALHRGRKKLLEFVLATCPDVVES
ncbi:sigma-70 family RNA polymerase sigma factor [Candidatus Fermentibacteria bacterium]|nr:sigma-70 family RNA polymerase sigma factor [Candidatus Fermentibacteria bacterium]